MRPSQLTLALILLTGCVDAGTTKCGDLLCPPGLVCASTQEACVLPSQNDACDGLQEGDACTFSAGAGFCNGGTCFDSRCANGILEGAEVCDDGNARSGDGCSADCMSDETCGNGIIDMVDERCDDGNLESGDGCQRDCQLPRCGDRSVDDGEACDDGNVIGGDGCSVRCLSNETCGNGVIDVERVPVEVLVDGVLQTVLILEMCDDGNLEVGDSCGATCQIELCGNGIIDPGEECDDDNTVGGDGCSAGCRSNETCGNGVIDPLQEEECDDGNLRSQDGCSSICTVELPTWTDARPVQSRRYGSMVFDGNRAQLLITGGEGGAGEGIVFNRRRQRGQWAYNSFPTQPSERIGHTTVYDANLRAVVLIAGRSPAQYNLGVPRLGRLLGDAWSLGPDGWTMIDALPARAYSAGAYEVAGQRVIVFGGEDGAPLDDTWAFDGTWTQLTPTTSPSPRSRHGMAYDAQRQVTVLHGGVDAAGDALSDTWEFDGVEWTEVVADGPVVRGSLVYDSRRNRVLLFGGSSNVVSNELWAFDGSWTLLSSDGPSPRLGAAVAYDPILGGLVVRSGAPNAPGDNANETWLYTDAWSLLNEQGAPSPRRGTAAVFDPRDDQVRVLGGELGSSFSETWTYGATGWEIGEPLPFDTRVTRAVHDRARRQNVLVTAADGDEELQTWINRAQRWERSPVAGPPARSNPGLTYDTERDAVLLYGGISGSTLLNDLWVFDGEWREIETVGPPPPSMRPLIEFDVSRGVMVCFPGGEGEAGLNVWELDGTTWTRLVPLPVRAAGLIYYEPSNSIWAVASFPPQTTVWSLDVDRWVPIRPPTLPMPRAGPFIVYDNARKSLVMGLGDPNTQTLSLRLGSRAQDEICTRDVDNDTDGLAGCEDPDCDSQRCGDNGERCSAGACVCEFTAEFACGDGLDDDCDGAVDCDDSDCASDVLCRRELDCQDGLDDDADGHADCDDPGCSSTAPCEAVETTCNDGIDNDGDGTIDCEDVSCYLRACLDLTP